MNAMTMTIMPTATRKRVLDWLTNRLFEWMATGMMLGIAVTIIMTPATIKVGAFRYLLDAGFTPARLGGFFLVVGLTRIAALIANGRWRPWGGRCRATCALFAATIWAQMGIALTILTQDTGTYSIGIPVYLFLTFGELVSCYRAAANDPYH